jgi:Fe2+ or Zn2+ uptake regulation protein
MARPVPAVQEKICKNLRFSVRNIDIYIILICQKSQKNEKNVLF